MQPMYWRTYAAKAAERQRKEMLFGFGKQNSFKNKIKNKGGFEV